MRWSALLCLSVLTSCVSPPPAEEKHDSKAEAERLKEFVLDAPPADVGTRVDADFGGKLTLLGTKIESSAGLKPGSRVNFTLYWRAQQKLDAGWKLFTHIVDASGERVLNIDNSGPLRQVRAGAPALPPSDWEPGKVYVDEQSFVIPASLKTEKIQILTGVFGKRGRLEITAGPHDTTRRAIAATLSVSGVRGQKNTRVPVMRVEKLEPATTIKLDGKLDEPAWKTAASTGALVDVRTGEPNHAFPVNGEVKVLWSDTGMYVGFSVAETDLVGGFKKGEPDPHLWTKDTVEIMVDPDGEGDNKDYYEIQINPQNLVFDSQFDAYNEPKVEPDGPFGHQDWSANLKSAVALDGTLDKSTDQDRGYTVEALIPWKSFGKAAKLPPEVDSSWRINFYAMKNNGGVAWSPILGQGNFHKASRFGRIVWTKKGASPPASSASTSASLAASSAAPSAASAAPAPSTSAPKAGIVAPPKAPLKVAPTPAASN
ncbi:MAG TPA: carbohydrate-binding family 9-like protein [Polyangiaceae bacterium]|nr:carbohydrate-binding family 9-like protein [Polyangiaceae bacterium]